MGVILGGLLVFVNFSFLQSTIINAFQNNPFIKKKKSVLIFKSFFRLTLLGGIIFTLIKYDLANPIGLATGLSIIFLSIVSMGIGSAWKSRNWRAF